MPRKMTIRKKVAMPASFNRVAAWEDDPLSGARPLERPAPDLSAQPLRLRIEGVAPLPRIYRRGTRQFRYWTAAEALRRGADFWAGLLPAGATWQPGRTLVVTLDQGVDLNAYYDRRGLWFFHEDIGGATVFSGESPDVLCHELGHAVLDAVRPQLWDAMSVEVAAFHESFGDLSAALSALQLPTVRAAVLTATGGKLYRTSRLSRLAEQLGWALRQIRPDLADPDCLRNAVNSFFYRDPVTLPSSSPASALSSEPHSFSRVFTGGYFEALALMLAGVAVSPTEEDLRQVSVDAGRLLVAAVRAAPVVPDYYSQVAAHVLEADLKLFSRKYHDALKSAFVRRGILSLQAAAATRISRMAGTVVAAPGTGRLSRLTLTEEGFGLGRRSLTFTVASEARRFAVGSAAFGQGSVPPAEARQAARAFVEYLFRRGRVDVGAHGDPDVRLVHGGATKTHRIREEQGKLVLVRRTFDCGFDAGSGAA